MSTTAPHKSTAPLFQVPPTSTEQLNAYFIPTSLPDAHSPPFHTISSTPPRCMESGMPFHFSESPPSEPPLAHQPSTARRCRCYLAVLGEWYTSIPCLSVHPPRALTGAISLDVCPQMTHPHPIYRCVFSLSPSWSVLNSVNRSMS